MRSVQNVERQGAVLHQQQQDNTAEQSYQQKPYIDRVDVVLPLHAENMFHDFFDTASTSTSQPTAGHARTVQTLELSLIHI